MNYRSTRNSRESVSSAQAIAHGISVDGGLFVPESIPSVSLDDLQMLTGKSYVERAEFVLSKYLTDFTAEELHYCVSNAYNTQNFDSESIVELAHLYNGNYMLELWHGPTCAFKDMALQLLPYLLTTSVKKVIDDKKVVILVATSGDTGKAALEGFKDVEGTQILVFYPEDGVSAMQKRQMITQEGSNVAVCAIQGNFDDAQTGVKKIFTDEATRQLLADNKMMFSSANSINWGRLVPQIVYYISAYCELVKNKEIALGEEINIVVPTGNFGNILAAYYAKRMGLPVKKLICASNKNKVLTDFINTGIYDRKRDFYTTISPSMDILISSNLERLLYEISGCDDELIRDWFQQLSVDGNYRVTDEVKAKIQQDFVGGFCDDEQTKQTIHDTFQTYSYLCDTHTAVALHVCEEYKKATGDNTKTLIASTASPYKFSASVLEAIAPGVSVSDEFEGVALLHELSKLPVPDGLSGLKGKEVRFKGSVSVQEMPAVVREMLGV